MMLTLSVAASPQKAAAVSYTHLAVVGQMGSLITKTLYIKQGTAKQFAIVDAGMTDLILERLA